MLNATPCTQVTTARSGTQSFGSGTESSCSARRRELPATRGKGGGIYVVIEDPDEHYARARAAGADITRELADTDYGSRDYGAKDSEGNSWWFGTYQPLPGAQK